MRAILRLTQHLTIVLLLLQSGPVFADQDPADLVGVWLTVDASDEQGRNQGGSFFRQDGTGGFLSATYTSKIRSEDELRVSFLEQLLEAVNVPRAGTADILFTYEATADVVEITMTEFRGLPIQSDPRDWLYEIGSEGLRLTAADEPSRWILMEPLD